LKSPEQPPTIDWLLSRRGTQWVPSTEETPLACLYRMYQDVVLDDNIGLRNEIEYFFYHSKWSVSSISDPKDNDSARYAILAVLPELLVVAFNRLIERGLSRGALAILTDENAKRIGSSTEGA
jgi:hypothetical protein